MRNKVGIIVASVLMVFSVGVAAGAAQPAQPAASPKGKVFMGVEAADNSVWVVYIGQGNTDAVPSVFIDYGATVCANSGGQPMPAIITGMTKVHAPSGGEVQVNTDGSVDFLCANEDMTRIHVAWTMFYVPSSDTLLWREAGNVVVELQRVCNGQAVNIPGFTYKKGTAGADTLEGTPGRDILDARGGNDTVTGGNGHDIICTGNGADIARGGKGHDLILGFDGKDELFGNKGKDVLVGGRNAGVEVIDGGPGWDFLYGFLGKDRLLGQGGSDVLWGGPHEKDVLRGGGGLDGCWDANSGTQFFSCEVSGPEPPTP